MLAEARKPEDVDLVAGRERRLACAVHEQGTARVAQIEEAARALERDDALNVDTPAGRAPGVEIQHGVRAAHGSGIRIGGRFGEDGDDSPGRHDDPHAQELSRGAEPGLVYAAHAHLRVDERFDGREVADTRKIDAQPFAESHEIDGRPPPSAPGRAHDTFDLHPLAVVPRHDRRGEPNRSGKRRPAEDAQPGPDDDRSEGAGSVARHVHEVARAHLVHVPARPRRRCRRFVLDEQQVPGRDRGW